MDSSSLFFWEQRSSRTRFNLLMMEFGESMLSEYSGVSFPHPNEQRSFEDCCDLAKRGRLYICTRSLFFEPNDTRYPVIRLPYKNCTGAASNYSHSIHDLRAKNLDMVSGIFSIQNSVVVEMKENNVIGPFKIIETATTPDRDIFLFGLIHSDVSTLVNEIKHLVGVYERAGESYQAQQELLKPILAPRLEPSFEPAFLLDFEEQMLLSEPYLVERVSPLLLRPGSFMITDQRVYFLPLSLNNVGEGLVSFRIRDIVQVYRRRHLFQQLGLEVMLDRECSGGTDGSHTYLFKFPSKKKRNNAYIQLRSSPHFPSHLQHTSILQYLSQWQRGEISNFDYLMLLNYEADRSLNDVTQYPVFPWVIKDYSSRKLSLSNPNTFRDLSRPIGALNEERLGYFMERMLSLHPNPSEYFIRQQETEGRLEARERAQERPQDQGRSASSQTSQASQTSDRRRQQQQRQVSEGGESGLRKGFFNLLGSPSSSPSPQQQDQRSRSGNSSSNNNNNQQRKEAEERGPRPEEREEAELAEQEDPPFLYGTHYSTPGYVLYYLLRVAPEHMLCLQNGKFDNSDRLFYSVEETFHSAMANPTDLKELVPEFYVGRGEWLRNSLSLDLGHRTGQMHTGDSRIGDVVLPRWAKSPKDFIHKCRRALESDYVSEHLHLWIDLIFGFKQQGLEAVKANNLFYHLTYASFLTPFLEEDDEEEAKDGDRRGRKKGRKRTSLASLENMNRQAIEHQINEFGQTPSQLFLSPHPSRSAVTSNTTSRVVLARHD